MPENTELIGNLRTDHIVEMARPLSLMRKVPFSIGELKVLDVYLSRINSHDPECRTVKFTKAEYEELMGINKTNSRTLKAYVEGMLGKVVDVPMPNDGWKLFVLFSRAEYTKDEYDVPTITLSCTEEARELFFGLESLGYLRIEIRNLLSLSRKSSHQLYMEIVRERYRGEWSVPLDRLRDDIFDLKDQHSYKAFKEFKRAVLSPAVKEINEKTNATIRYEPVKRGRTVTDIKFTYVAQEPSQVSFEDFKELQEAPVDREDEYDSELTGFLADACDYEFAEPDIRVIADLVVQRIPCDHTGTERYNYLRRQYNRLKQAADKRRISNRYAYLCQMIERDR